MILCDTHADTLYAMASNPGHRTDVTLPRLKAAGVSLQTLALFVGSSTDKEEVLRFNGLMMDAFDKLKAQGLLQAFDPREAEEGQTKCMLSIEGCEILEGGLDLIDRWRARGVRMAALTWNYENALATPAKLDRGEGLKPYGKQAVRRMIEVGVAPDTSHLNERGFWDILEMGVVPLASHSCCKALCPHRRNLTDEQLRALFEAGGYVGVNFYPHFLKEGGDCTLDTVCDHVLHMFRMGGEGKVGFGSDFDGIECKVKGLSDPSDVPALIERLMARGLTREQVEGVAGKNLLAYYDRVFPKGEKA